MKQADNCVNADCPYQTGQPCQAATGCGGFMAESNDLVNALLKVSVETGSLVCLGCGYEHSCGTRGCAILREAVETLKAQDAEIAALRNPSPENKPLTLAELREMEGEPVWVVSQFSTIPTGWFLLHKNFYGKTIDLYGPTRVVSEDELHHCSTPLLFYRRPPKHPLHAKTAR